ERRARVAVERDELTREFSREHETAGCGKHPGRAWHVGERNLPLLLTGERIDGDEMPVGFAGLDLRESSGHTRGVAPKHLRRRLSREFLDARQVPGTRIDQP